MTFPECAARSFTLASIQKNAPASPGVYALSNACEWLFVGESENIRAQLLKHFEERGTALQTKKPTGFTFEMCSLAECSERRRSLARALQLRSNRTGNM